MTKLLLSRARVATLILATAAVTPMAAQAGTASSNLNVSAEVQAACRITTTPIAFGTVDVATAADNDAQGALQITCTNGTIYTASAGVGSGIGASYSTRFMASGADKLGYNIYTTAQRAVVFGDGAGTGVSAPIAGIGSGTQQTVTVYGRIPGSQNSVRAGSYTDTVAITVTY